MENWFNLKSKDNSGRSEGYHLYRWRSSFLMCFGILLILILVQNKPFAKIEPLITKDIPPPFRF
jgi:hypothetical protein